MKKEKRRLVLSGTDDAYAKREAAQDPKSADASALKAAAPVMSASKLCEPKSDGAGKTDYVPATPATETDVNAKAPPSLIQVNYRLNLGPDLSARLQRLADAHDQPIDLVMKGIRNKAVDRFKALASGATKPPIPDPASGGQSIRYAATLAGELAKKLNMWFDPFGLGVAKDACKPILIWLFQEEARALCDVGDSSAPNRP